MGDGGVTDIRGRVWRNGKPQDDFEFSAISDYLVEDDALVWCDIYTPDHAVLEDLAQELELDSWAVEDALADAERTKAAVYRTHTFFTVYGVKVKDPLPEDESESTLDIHRISGFVLPRGLITVRCCRTSTSTPCRSASTNSAGRSTASARWCMGCSMSWSTGTSKPYSASTTASSRSRTHCSRTMPRKGLQRKTFRLRKDLVELRRVVLPMREVVNSIQHRRLDAKTAPELDPLYADLYDHVLRASEWTESVRDMITTVFETNLSLQDARLNTVMKKLTGWAAIIAVPTAITGFYGQNVTVSRHRDRRWFRDQHGDHRAAGARPVLDVQTARLVVAHGNHAALRGVRIRRRFSCGRLGGVRRLHRGLAGADVGDGPADHRMVERARRDGATGSRALLHGPPPESEEAAATSGY